MFFSRKIFLVTMVLLIATVFYFAKQSDRSLVIKSENKTVEEIGEQKNVGSEDEEIIIDNNKNDDIVTKKENVENNDFFKDDNIGKEVKKENVKERMNNVEKKREKNDKEKDAQEQDDIKIKNKLVNWGFSKSNERKIDTIILHSSYDALGDEPYDVDGLIAEYKEYGVSPHYLIDRKGNIYRLVEDKNIAWHAGESEVPDGRKNVNNFSIGIELINTKSDEYTKKQYQSVQNLIDYLKKKYKIKYVLGHNDIAPGRKTDPWNFDWENIVK